MFELVWDFMDKFCSLFYSLVGSVKSGYKYDIAWLAWTWDTKTCSVWVSSLAWLVIKHFKFNRLWNKLSSSKLSTKWQRLDIEDFWEIDPALCQYAYAFCKSDFTSSSITMKILAGTRLSESFRAWKFALRSAKLQMFDDQSCYIWHPIRACFGTVCSCLDANNGTFCFQIVKLSFYSCNTKFIKYLMGTIPFRYYLTITVRNLVF